VHSVLLHIVHMPCPIFPKYIDKMTTAIIEAYDDLSLLYLTVEQCIFAQVTYCCLVENVLVTFGHYQFIFKGQVLSRLDFEHCAVYLVYKYYVCVCKMWIVVGSNCDLNSLHSTTVYNKFKLFALFCHIM